MLLCFDGGFILKMSSRKVMIERGKGSLGSRPYSDINLECVTLSTDYGPHESYKLPRKLQVRQTANSSGPAADCRSRSDPEPRRSSGHPQEEDDGLQRYQRCEGAADGDQRSPQGKE